MIALKDDQQQSAKMADINKIPTGGVITLTHSLAVYNSAVNGLLLNFLSCKVQLLTGIMVGSQVLF